MARRWSGRVLTLLAGVFLVAACVCFVEAWRSTAGRHLVPFRAAVVAPVIAPLPPRPTSTTTPAVPAPVAPPVRLVIPAVSMSARIVPVGLNSQGQLEVPSPSLAGWYRLGPAPGAEGPAVIVGHVDMVAGPAVFYRLTGVRAGEEVDVLRADGRRSRFVINRLTQVNKTAFPTQAVFGPTATPTLRLITCTGPFNPSSHHYIDSLIVWAVPAA